MGETKESQENIEYIRTHVDNLEQLQRLAISANPQVKAYVEEQLISKKGSAQLYLHLLEGPKTAEQLIKVMKQSPANISRICSHLIINGLASKVRSVQDPKKVFFVTTAAAEQLLGVGKIAKRIIRKER